MTQTAASSTCPHPTPTRPARVMALKTWAYHAAHRQFDRSECLSEVLTVYIILGRGNLVSFRAFLNSLSDLLSES